MLILALIVVFLMTVLVSDITNVSVIEYEASVNGGKLVRLKYGLEAGFEIAKANLVQDGMDTDIDSLGDAWSQPIRETLGGESSRSIEEQASEDATGQVELTIEIEDEESKWPLPLLFVGKSDAETKRHREFLAAVIDSYREDYGSRDVDAGLADRYAELITAFMMRREGEPGIVPRPNTKSEMHVLNVADFSLIKEIDDNVFFDEIDENGTIVPGLLRYVTIWSDLKVNVNTAPLPVLKGLFRREDRGRAVDMYHHRNAQTEEKEKEKSSLSERLDREKGKTGEDEEDRTGGAIFEKVDDVMKVEGFSPRVFSEASKKMTVSSRTFSIWVTAELGNMVRMRHWVVRREDGRIVVMLSEAIDPDYRPRFRKRTAEEESEAGLLPR
jgi:type II secretory pathway component PulK